MSSSSYPSKICRICRPGSIVGPQQQFLVSIEAKMFHEGNQYRERAKGTLKESTDHKRLATNTSSNGTLASGVTDPGDASGRTTPLIFQQGSGKHSSTGKSVHEICCLFFNIAFLSRKSL